MDYFPLNTSLKQPSSIHWMSSAARRDYCQLNTGLKLQIHWSIRCEFDMDRLNAPVHVLAVPYPAQGHINPMIQLCKKLASSGNVRVTCVLTHEWYTLISKSSAQGENDFRSNQNIGFAQIPNAVPSEERRWTNFEAFFKAVMNNLEGPVEQVIDKLIQEGNAISCIIADTFLSWTLSVAKKYRVPLAVLWAMPFTAFSIFCHSDLLMANGHFLSLGSSNAGECIDHIPGVPALHPIDLPSIFHEKDMANCVLNIVLQTFKSIEQVDWIVANSFYELESQAVDAVVESLKVPVYCVGPLLPSAYLDGLDPQDMTFGTSCRTELDCSEWLDSKAMHSIVYVSFGSLVGFSSVQIEEIAMGLLEAGHPFLWVLRGNAVEMLPRRFLDETKSKGLIVPWTNQLAVLSHPAVGAFFTHCGWNSTLESLSSGVPMLAFPVAMDQFPNSKLVVDEWKIGLRLLKLGALEQETVIDAGEISRHVKILMDGEEGKEMRKRAQALRSLAKRAVMKGGSSHTNLHKKFIGELVKYKDKSIDSEKEA